MDSLTDEMEYLKDVSTVELFFLIAGVLGAAVQSAIAVIEIFSYNFTDLAYTIGTSTDLSIAATMTIVGVLGTGLLNGFKPADIMDYNRIEQAAVAVGLSGPVLFILSPDFANFVTGNDIVGTVYTILVGGAVLVLASR